MEATEVDYPLSQVLEIMKPCKIDPDKASHQEKLQKAFNSPSYIAEKKIDGCHYVCIGGRFFSTQRSKKTGMPTEKSDNFPHLVEAFVTADLGQAVLDGEIYYPDDNKSYGATKITGCKGDEAVRRQEEEQGWISYMIFDILRTPDGKWLLDQPWKVRREILESLKPQLQEASEHFHVIDVKRSGKEKFLDDVLAAGEEGIVLKHVNGFYIPGKRPMWNWIKLKVDIEDDVVIMDYDPPAKEYTGKDPENWPYWVEGEPVSKHYYYGWIGTIAFGKYDQNGQLVYLGTTSGISESLRKELSENGDAYIGKVIKISAMEKTEDGKYRHPRFLGFHPDKNPEECVIEEG